MVEAFEAICVDRMLKSLPAINANPARQKYQGQRDWTTCKPEKRRGWKAVRRVRSASNVSPNKGTVLRQFRGPRFPPSNPPSSTSFVSSEGPQPLAASSARRGKKLQRAAEVVSCNLSVPLEAVGAPRLKRDTCRLQIGAAPQQPLCTN